MPSRLIWNQVSLTRPGTESILTPNAGMAHEWITSSAVVSSLILAPTGSTTASSVASRRGCPSSSSSSSSIRASKVKSPWSGYS